MKRIMYLPIKITDRDKRELPGGQSYDEIAVEKLNQTLKDMPELPYKPWRIVSINRTYEQFRTTYTGSGHSDFTSTVLTLHVYIEVEE